MGACLSLSTHQFRFLHYVKPRMKVLIILMTSGSRGHLNRRSAGPSCNRHDWRMAGKSPGLKGRVMNAVERSEGSQDVLVQK